MAPKKKGNKKGNDDWEAELGEAPDPIAAATQEAKDNNAENDIADDRADDGGGGLLAALKKNKKNKRAKGKHVEDDFVEGEDPPTANGVAEPDSIADLVNKAGPEEATADDVFAEAPSKGKGNKSKPAKKEETPKDDADDDGEGGGLKSKKEKEKEKKEREKQRKKEQVRSLRDYQLGSKTIRTCLTDFNIGKGREEEDSWNSDG